MRFILLCALAACGAGSEDTGPENPDCSLTIPLTGGINSSKIWGEPQCQGTYTNDPPMFGGTWFSDSYSITLKIYSQIVPSEGAAFAELPGMVEVWDLAADQTWATRADDDPGCTFQITDTVTDVDMPSRFWLAGTGACALPLRQDDGAGEATVGDIAFEGMLYAR